MTAEKERRGIQSVEIGTKLLLALANNGLPMPLRDVAKGAGITISKAHPYMVTFTKVGFVVQTAAGFYELGPLALDLGLVRLQRLDTLKESAPHIEGLAIKTGMSVAVTVWGNRGPTVVRLEQPAQPLHMALRVGTVMSMTNTATGRLFAAFLPPAKIERLLNEERPRSGGKPSAAFDDKVLARIRASGVSVARGKPLPGVSAIAAPVLGAMGQIELGVTLIGPAAMFDAVGEAALTAELKQCVRLISKRLGSRAAEES